MGYRQVRLPRRLSQRDLKPIQELSPLRPEELIRCVRGGTKTLYVLDIDWEIDDDIADSIIRPTSATPIRG